MAASEKGIEGDSRTRRIRPLLLVLLWVWAALMFVVIDLFLNVPHFDRVRPDGRVYRGMREAAHDMVGERYYEGELERAAIPAVTTVADRDVAKSNPYANRKSAPPGERPARVVRTHRRTPFRDHGTWTQWNLPGLKAGQGEINDTGRKRGAWTWKWDDDTPREERNYTNGVLDGDTTAWFRDGRKQSEEHYEKGKRVGTWRYWHSNGTLAAQQEYTVGVPHGIWLAWHADGARSMRGEYREGLPVGAWVYWNERGDLIKEYAHD